MTTTATARNEASKATHTADSVYIHDSVYIREASDTMFIDRWHTQWRDRIVHDTVIEHSTDTVILTETVEKLVEVPKKGGNAGWTAALTLLAVIIIYIYLKTR